MCSAIELLIQPCVCIFPKSNKLCQVFSLKKIMAVGKLYHWSYIKHNKKSNKTYYYYILR